MRTLIVALAILVCLPGALSLEMKGNEIEATTKISLPVDSVTIYPDGLVSVRRTGTMDLTQGVHKLVLDVPSTAKLESVLLLVTNSSVQKIVYDSSPVYTLNVMSAGMQRFTLTYLMDEAGLWLPSYSLHLMDSSLVISANAIIANNFEEDLKDVRLKLVSSLSQIVPMPKGAEKSRSKAVDQDSYYYEEAALAMEAAPAAPEEPSSYIPPYVESSTGELESLYVFEIENRTDLEMKKEIGLPLFEETVPISRIFTWDASSFAEGPVKEVIRANNTMDRPWPAGLAMMYRDGDYISSIAMPYTASGTNATIEVGSSPDLKVSRKLKEYNVTQEIKGVMSADGRNHTAKVTTEMYSYQLEIKSNLDREAKIEVTDSRPIASEMISLSPEPSETTASQLKWELEMFPRQETKISYTYRIVKTETLGGL